MASAYPPPSFRRSYSAGAHVTAPASFRAPCLLGIDEAGRGPVSGPMVYGICYCPLTKTEELGKMGFADSKQLTEEQRDKLFDAIKAAPDTVGWTVTVLQPQHISESMLRKFKYNLNQLSHDTAIDLVQDALDRGVNVQEVYVDTVGDSEKYQAKLVARFPAIRKIVVSKKADSLFPIVSAASICAKVTRDDVLRRWEFEEKGLEVTREFGSGYPGDPVTVQWLQRHFHPVFGFPSIVRFSWSTAYRIIDTKAVAVHWPLESGAPDPADEETDEAVAATPSVLQFFKRSGDASDGKPSAGAKRARTGTLWGSMGLRAVTDL